jgi:hypothetical protein
VPNVECIPQGKVVSKDIFKIFMAETQTLSFIDYLAGRKSGFYFPALPPIYQMNNNNNNNKKKIDYTTIMQEELLRQCLRKGVGMSLI